MSMTRVVKRKVSNLERDPSPKIEKYEIVEKIPPQLLCSGQADPKYRNKTCQTDTCKGFSAHQPADEKKCCRKYLASCT